MADLVYPMLVASIKATIVSMLSGGKLSSSVLYAKVCSLLELDPDEPNSSGAFCCAVDMLRDEGTIRDLSEPVWSL